jgi:hypothetical protein
MRIAYQAGPTLLGPLVGLLVTLAIVGQGRAQPSAMAQLPAPLQGGPTDAADDTEAGAKKRGDLEGLVRQLGADSYADRQAAAARLLATGEAAIVPLRGVLDSPDFEVRSASERLLWEIESNLAVTRFLESGQVEPRFPLPGWEAFRTRIADDREAREMFREISRDSPELMDFLHFEPQLAAILLEMLVERELHRLRLVPVPLANGAEQGPPPVRIQIGVPLDGELVDRLSKQRHLAAWLFVASDPRVPLSLTQVDGVLRLIDDHPDIVADGETPHDRLVFRLADACLARLFADSDGSRKMLPLRGAIIRASMKKGFPTGVETARLTLRSSGPNADAFIHALLYLGKVGDPEDLQRTTNLLENSTVLKSLIDQGVRKQVQLRDVALAILLHWAGEDLAAYGFHHARTDPVTLFEYGTLYFDSPANRDDALAKWRGRKTDAAAE